MAKRHKASEAPEYFKAKEKKQQAFLEKDTKDVLSTISSSQKSEKSVISLWENYKPEEVLGKFHQKLYKYLKLIWNIDTTRYEPRSS